MKVLISHPTGNQNVRAILSSFLEKNVLLEFNTTISISATDFWLRFLPGKSKRDLLRRNFPLPPDMIWTHPAREYSRIVASKLGFTQEKGKTEDWMSVYNVYKDFDIAVAKRLSYHKKQNTVSCVYAYEDGALATFTKAKELGLQCIYDLPIAYWTTVRDLLNREALRLPNWKKTFGGGITDTQEKLERKTEELALADVVIGPSQFVIDSLPSEMSGKKTIMSPFGSPDTSQLNSSYFNQIDSRTDRPLRVLFAGSMGQRKGLADLFAAFALLNNKRIELVVIGSLLDSLEFYKSEFPDFTYEPTRPHHQVLELMRSCDVFCLPSIVEGRALVMQEAMSQGLPIIITPNTGGEDLVIDGETGFLVPISSPQAIAEKINWFAENRNKIRDMGEHAKILASQYSWKRYGETILQGIEAAIL